MPQELFALVNSFVGHRNPWYMEAKALMVDIPLPIKEEDRADYERKIKKIVDSCLQKAAMFSEASSFVNDSSGLQV